MPKGVRRDRVLRMVDAGEALIGERRGDRGGDAPRLFDGSSTRGGASFEKLCQSSINLPSGPQVFTFLTSASHVTHFLPF